ncbi:hypothetical protein TSACC_2546 [Terrimicrobium sacchariphilum]|uniref:Uncharacterized protein n=1 Tax=Terrimicrobium sacchariphilum TaxID=690879 RepID=A0A146G2S2_TERSA|nr:hypothetical protein [Terrimicrobium sacchariphilum]GAT32149.1 hypothetical protein TSACC_2546 [Terrimicrobium sacchariphilum]
MPPSARTSRPAHILATIVGILVFFSAPRWLPLSITEIRYGGGISLVLRIIFPFILAALSYRLICLVFGKLLTNIPTREAPSRPAQTTPLDFASLAGLLCSILVFYITSACLLLPSTDMDLIATSLWLFQTALPLALAILVFRLSCLLLRPRDPATPAFYRLATSPAHFAWCILEPLVIGSAFLSYYLPRNSYYIPPLLNAVVAFGVLIAPLILLANALALRRKSTILAIISVLTVLGALVALSLPVIT